MKLFLSALLFIAMGLLSLSLQAQTKAVPGTTTTNTPAGKTPPATTPLSAKDFKDLVLSKGDNRVVNYRQGNIQYTMIPLRDLYLTPKRKEAFDVTLNFIGKASEVWLARAYGISFPDQMGYVEQALKNKTAEEIRALSQTNGARPGMPTDAEIVAKTRDAKTILEKQKARNKFLIEYDEMIEAFDSAESLITHEDANAGSDGFKKLVPTAIMGVIGIKVPAAWLEFTKSNKLLAPVGFLGNGSLTLTPIIRPWYVVSTNLDTGEVKEEGWDFETTLQGWYLKDFKTDKLLTNAGMKFGVGAVFGDYDKVEDIGGITLSYARNFSFRNLASNYFLNTSGTRSLKTTIRLGTIAAGANTFTDILNPSSFLENGFVTLTRQVGGELFTDAKAHTEWGYSRNITDITNLIEPGVPSLAAIIKEAAELVPGSDIIFVNGQMRVRTHTSTAPEAVLEKTVNPPTVESPASAQSVLQKSPAALGTPSRE